MYSPRLVGHKNIAHSWIGKYTVRRIDPMGTSNVVNMDIYVEMFTSIN